MADDKLRTMVEAIHEDTEAKADAWDAHMKPIVDALVKVARETLPDATTSDVDEAIVRDKALRERLGK